MNNSLVDLFYKSEDYFMRSISVDCLDLDDAATAYFSGVSAAHLNPVLIRKPIGSMDGLLKKARLFYERHQSPWLIVLPDVFRSQASILNAAGFYSDEKTATMFLNLDAHEPMRNRYEIRFVNNALQEWGRPLIEAFESTDAIVSQYIQAHERALERGAQFYHFCAYRDKDPVASVTLSVRDQAARIDDLGTLPAYRGKGYATELMRHALSHAKKLGVVDCFLESSSVGLSLYKKLGFRPLFENAAFVAR